MFPERDIFVLIFLQEVFTMATLLIKNGILVTASDEFKADILVKDGKIKAIGKGIAADADEVYDAAGKYVMPGGVDQHTHFNFKFGDAVVMGWETSCGAVVGGTTTVIDFCNQEVGHTMKYSIDHYRSDKIEGKVACDYALHVTLFEPKDEIVNEIAKLPEYGVSTCKMFMAYKGHDYHCDDDVVLKGLKVAGPAGVTTMLHCENADMIDVLQKECIAKGQTEPYGHAVSRPPIVEAECTNRAISLAKLAGSPLYIVHVTTKGAIDAVRDANEAGYPIFGETCTHYLTLTKDKLAKPGFEGAKYVCSPALREQEDLDALWTAVDKGWLNAISSDHCGFSYGTHKQQGKDDFRNIPNGAPGMEDRMNVIWTEGVAKGRISRSKFVELCCTNPAKNNGIYPQKGTLAIGSDADIVIFDPDYKGRFTVEESYQGVDYNAYEGMEQTGRPDKVFLRGKLVADCGKYVGTPGEGEFVKGKPFAIAFQQ